MDTQVNASESQPSQQQTEDVALSISNSIFEQGDSETAPREETSGSSEDVTGGAEQSAEPEVHESNKIEVSSKEEPQYAVKIDGEEKSVSLSELREHYQKGQAAELRFQEAAQIRHAAEAERGTLMEAISAYHDQLETIKKASEPDWVALARENPQAWAEQKALYEQIESKQREAAEQYAALQATHEQTQKERFDGYCRTEAAHLKKAIPEWSTAEAYEKGIRDVAMYLGKFGFGESDIHSMNDHRIWVVAKKAMMFDNAMAEAPKQIQKTPPLRVEKSGSAAGVENKTKAALGKFKGSRDPDDLDAAFIEYLNGN